MGLDELKESNRTPILFFGSGMGLRYVKNYPNWKGLLTRISEKIGLENYQINSILAKVKNTDINIENCQFADEIEKLLFEKIYNKDVENLFSERDMERINNEQINPFKLLIANVFENVDLKEDKTDEIESLRKAITKVGTIITTNYDKFIETIAPDYIVKYRQEDLYFTKEFEFTHIYKIHGTIDDVNSIIITTKDYEQKEKKSLLLDARIYNLLLNSPIFFIGYSLSDKDVMNILSTFISCFDSGKIAGSIAKNIVLVQYEKNQNELNVIENYPIAFNGTTIPITLIKTDNYKKLFDYIGDFKVKVSPAQIYKYKSIISKLIKEHEDNGNVIRVIDESLLTRDIKDLAVAIGSIEDIADVMADKGISGLKYQDIVKGLFLDKPLPYKKIVDIWMQDSSNISMEYLVPVYTFLKKYPEAINNEKFRMLKQTIDEKMKIIYDNYSIVDNTIKKESILNYSTKTKLTSIEQRKLYNSLIKGIISRDEFFLILKGIVKNSPDKIKSTEIKRLICFGDCDMDELKKMKSSLKRKNK